MRATLTTSPSPDIMWLTSLITSLGAFFASSSENRSSVDFTSLMGLLSRVRWVSVFAKHVGTNHATGLA